MMNYHPVVYGVKKGAQKVSDSGMVESINSFYSKYFDQKKHVMIHPLYVTLQKRSPLNMLLKAPFDIKDHEYD